MGKGVMPDDHPLSVGAARSHALEEADVILLLGARLNWIMHFGLPPRFNPDVRVLQLDITPRADRPQRARRGRHSSATARAVMGQLNAELADDPWRTRPTRRGAARSPPRSMATDEVRSSRWRADDSLADELLPRVPGHRRRLRPDDIIVGEGANTMDIGRTQMPNAEPRHRLDAGSYGTMGVGLGFAIAAAVCNPGKRVVTVQGDSAFGFSGMEMETICRYRLPVVVVILNNNGIGGGSAELPTNGPPPPHMYLPTARYEKIAEAFGAGSFYVEDPAELRAALDDGRCARRPIHRARQA